MPLLGQAIGAAIGAGLATSLSVRAWRSSVDEWRIWSQRWRPKSWRNWPLYATLWCHMDEHTAPYLWFARVMLSVAAIFIALGCSYAILQLVGSPV